MIQHEGVVAEVDEGIARLVLAITLTRRIPEC